VTRDRHDLGTLIDSFLIDFSYSILNACIVGRLQAHDDSVTSLDIDRRCDSHHLPPYLPTSVSLCLLTRTNFLALQWEMADLRLMGCLSEGMENQ
jgi:hypothetical protein